MKLFDNPNIFYTYFTDYQVLIEYKTTVYIFIHTVCIDNKPVGVITIKTKM